MNYIQHGRVLLSEWKFKEETSPPVLPANSFETHKKDLATLDKNEQAPLVVHMLDGDTSGIKEKFDENV